MTVGTEKPYYNHDGDGVNTQFDFDFYIQDETQIKVTLLNSLTQPQYGVDYEITGIKNPDGGHVTFPIEGSDFEILGEGEVISLTQELPIVQPKPYPESENLKMKNIEDGLDYLTRVVKILDRKIERSVKTKEGSEQSADELMNSLEQAQINALESATASANSATDANNKANIATEQAEIATEQANITIEYGSQMLSNIQQNSSDILDLSNNKADKTELELKADKTELDGEWHYLADTQQNMPVLITGTTTKNNLVDLSDYITEDGWIEVIVELRASANKARASVYVTSSDQQYIFGFLNSWKDLSYMTNNVHCFINDKKLYCSIEVTEDTANSVGVRLVAWRKSGKGIA